MEPFEELGEVVYIHAAAVLGHRLHLQAAALQKMRRVFHPHLTDKLRERFPWFFSEYGG